MSAIEQLPAVLESEGFVAVNAHEGMSDAFFALNSNWQFTYLNHKAAEFFRENTNNLIGKYIFDDFSGVISKDLQDICLQACAKQTDSKLEEFHPTKQRWYKYQIYPSPDGVSILIQDITLQKHSEIGLQKGEQQYRRIINTSDEGIWILDNHLNTEHVNTRLAEMLGYRPEEMIGHQTEDFLFAEDWKDHNQRRKSRNNVKTERYECRLQRKDGSPIWVIFSAMPIIDDNGVFQGSFAMLTDITDRKQAEESLDTKEQLLSVMSRMAKIGAWEFDPITLKGTWTDETARIHGLNPGDETNVQKGLSFYMGESHQKIKKAVKDAIEKGEPYDLELELISAKGKHKWVRSISNPTMQNGRVVKVQGTFHDITERKNAEQAIQQSNLFLNSLIDQSPNAMWISDEKGALVRINPAGCKLLNLTPDEVIGKYNIFKDNIIKEQNLLPLVRSVFKEGKTAHFALRYDSSQLKSIQVKNTSFVILDVTIFPIKDICGKVTNAVIQLNNITVRKIAEDALRQSEFKFRKFVEEATFGIILIDEKGGIIEWNRAMQELTGITRDEIMYTPCWDIYWSVIPEETRKMEVIPSLKSQILEALQTGEAPFLNQLMELAIKHTDGETHYLLQSAFPIKFEHGFWLGVISRDITKRKQAEENLRQSEDKFSKAFQASPNMLAITRLSNGRIIEVNDVFVDHLGHSRDDIIGHTPSELNMWVDRKQLRIYLTALKEQIHVREMEVRFKVKSGKILDCLLSGDIISLNNEACILSTILDITQRKSQEEKIERQLQRFATLRSIDTAITSSFDLRISLGIILDHVTTQLDVDAAAVMTLNPHLNCLEFAAQRGFFSTGFTLHRIQLNEDPVSRAIYERQMVSIPDLKKAEHPLATSKYICGENLAACFIAPLIVKGQVKGVLEIFHRTPLNPDHEWLSFLEAIAGQTAIALDNAELFQGLQRSNAELILAYNDTLEGWSTALDLRDKETEGHSQRVVELTLQIARAMGINDAELVHIRRGALLHDIGKMGVPDSILLKPGTLSEEEWQIELKHPVYAYQMLSPIAYLRPALDIPYCHHEKWDGTGYPRGLKGEQIPLAARIFALVDVWDALRSDRPYRPAWCDEEALKYIREQSGIFFDPEVVDTFFNLLPSFEKQ